jgi:hypothetical protein
MSRHSRTGPLGAFASAIEQFLCESLGAFERIITTVKRVNRVAAVGVSATVLMASGSRAATILSDNFDGYADQAAFQAAWPAIGTDTTFPSALLQSTNSVSSTNAIQTPGEANTNNRYRNRRSFSETSTVASSGNLGVGDQLVWSFDFYDSDSTKAPARNYSNLQDTTSPVGTNQLISMGLNNNEASTDSGGNYYMARILGYSPGATDPDGGPAEKITGTAQYFKLNDFASSPLRSTGWHNLKVVITTPDAVTTNYAFFVDGNLAEKVSGVGATGTLRSYDNIAIGSGLTNAGIEADFDNEKLEMVVPEPASLGLLAAGALLCVRRPLRPGRQSRAPQAI